MAERHALIEQMEAIISELEREGSLDHHFRTSIALTDVNGRWFFANLLPTFMADTRSALRELTRHLETVPELVDFEAVMKLGIKLRGATSSIGACRMAEGCYNLRGAAAAKSYERCTQLLNSIRHEFSTIYDRLDAIGQLLNEASSCGLPA
ncbi:hypothetical protein Ancab_023639 [Ancistrocladus abbreviatus]